MEAPQAEVLEKENSRSEMLSSEDDQLSERVSEKDTNATDPEVQTSKLKDEGSVASGWEEAVKESTERSGQNLNSEQEMKINIPDQKESKEDKPPSKNKWKEKLQDSFAARNDFLPFRIAVGVAIVATILIVAGGAALSTRPWLAKSGAASSAYFSTGTVSAGVISCGSAASIGLISVGIVSVGTVSVGVFSVGIFSFGFFSIGLVSFGNFVLGLWAWGVYCAWIKALEDSMTLMERKQDNHTESLSAGAGAAHTT